MKKCRYCGKEYPDEATACAIDSSPLEIIAPAPTVAVGRPSRKLVITKISPIRTGAVIGIIYGFLSLLFVLFTLCALIFRGHSGVTSHFGGGVLLIFTPLIYGILGFVGGVVVAFIYNLTVGITGGLSFEVQDDSPTA